MGQQEMEELIDKAIERASQDAERTDDQMVKYALDALHSTREKVIASWPLSGDDAITYLGLHATRNLLPDFEELSDFLIQIDFFARHPTMETIPSF